MLGVILEVPRFHDISLSLVVNPDREPGRVTLITRYGAAKVYSGTIRSLLN